MEKITNALVIYGSPHENGKTAMALNFFKNKMDFISKWYTINAYKKNAKPCIDCGKCKKINGCVFCDLEDLNYYLKICDLLVLAFPVYNNSFPAPFKAIIDRMQRYYNFKKSNKAFPFEKHKKCVVILSAGSYDFQKNIIAAQIGPALKILNIIDINYIILKNTDDKKLNIDKFLLESQNSIEDIIKNLR